MQWSHVHGLGCYPWFINVLNRWFRVRNRERITGWNDRGAHMGALWSHLTVAGSCSPISRAGAPMAVSPWRAPLHNPHSIDTYSNLLSRSLASVITFQGTNSLSVHPEETRGTYCFITSFSGPLEQGVGPGPPRFPKVPVGFPSYTLNNAALASNFWFFSF